MSDGKGYGPCLQPGSLEIALEKTLNPNAVPSMGQDRRQKRRSEVDMFAGTVIRLGRELGLEMPVKLASNNNVFTIMLIRDTDYAGE